MYCVFLAIVRITNYANVDGFWYLLNTGLIHRILYQRSSFERSCSIVPKSKILILYHPLSAHVPLMSSQTTMYYIRSHIERIE